MWFGEYCSEPAALCTEDLFVSMPYPIFAKDDNIGRLVFMPFESSMSLDWCSLNDVGQGCTEHRDPS